MVQRALVWAVLDEGACKEDEFSSIFELLERNNACSCYLISRTAAQTRRKRTLLRLSTALSTSKSGTSFQHLRAVIGPQTQCGDKPGEDDTESVSVRMTDISAQSFFQRFRFANTPSL